MDKVEVAAKIGDLFGYDPDDVEKAIDEVALEHGIAEVEEGLEGFKREIPTGEGLSKREARKLLISEVNHHIQTNNMTRLNKYRRKTNEYWERVRAVINAEEGEEVDLKVGVLPSDPILLDTLTYRHLNYAVHRARHLGTYGELLEAAGFRAKR